MVENIRNAVLTIGTSSVVVSEEQSPYNAQRKVILLINTSTSGQKITICPDDDAVVGTGVVIGSGGYYQDSQDAGYKPTNARITAIADGAGATLAIHERIESVR